MAAGQLLRYLSRRGHPAPGLRQVDQHRGRAARPEGRHQPGYRRGAADGHRFAAATGTEPRPRHLRREPAGATPGLSTIGSGAWRARGGTEGEMPGVALIIKTNQSTKNI